MERMTDAAGGERERTRHRLGHLITVLQSYLARQHDKELILVLVGVKRRCETFQDPKLVGREATLGLLRRCLKDAEPAVEPQCFAVIRSERVPGGVCGRDIVVSVLPFEP